MNHPEGEVRSSVEVVAHRGASAIAPENTLGAVKRAWELDVDAVEIDVRLSADGQLVMIHDETLERTAGRCDRVSDFTAEELSRVDVGSWFGAEWAAERVSTLREVIATVPDGKRLFVELKCGALSADALEGPLAEVATAPQKVALIGFDQDLMGTVKKRYPSHEVFLVARQDFEEKVWQPSVDDLIESARSEGLDGLHLSNTPAVDRTAVSRIHEADLNCFVWVVDTIADARRLISAGADGLTMDDPGLLCE